jgi:hypothetical protein
MFERLFFGELGIVTRLGELKCVLSLYRQNLRTLPDMIELSDELYLVELCFEDPVAVIYGVISAVILCVTATTPFFVAHFAFSRRVHSRRNRPKSRPESKPEFGFSFVVRVRLPY